LSLSCTWSWTRSFCAVFTTCCDCAWWSIRRTVVLEPMTYVTNVVFETSLSKHMFIRVCLENINKAVGGGCFCYDVFFQLGLWSILQNLGLLTKKKKNLLLSCFLSSGTSFTTFQPFSVLGCLMLKFRVLDCCTSCFLFIFLSFESSKPDYHFLLKLFFYDFSFLVHMYSSPKD